MRIATVAACHNAQRNRALPALRKALLATTDARLHLRQVETTKLEELLIVTEAPQVPSLGENDQRDDWANSGEFA